jgi:D-alanyl-D-alanine carboxypeptidase
MLSQMQLEIHRELGIAADYGVGGRPRFYADATDLVDVGPNLVGRMQRLTPRAAGQWAAMAGAAGQDGIRLLLVSGFRSFEYQAELIRKKLQSGQALADILTVNAAPGFSQHHSGDAIDIASPGSRPLTGEFEASVAYGWLRENADRFGFSLTYPRDNPDGFVFEPWHWSL